VPWGTPVEITSLEISSANNETDPTISANHLVVAISAEVSSGDTDIFIGTRADVTDGFTVANASSINSSSDEECPELSADGKTLYFTSNRSGQYDVYAAFESGGVWSPPAILPSLSTHDDSNLAVSPDGLTAVVLDESAANKFYLHTRNTTLSPWGMGTRIPEFEITDDIASPAITNGAATIYFHANPSRDIYVAHRNPGGSFSTPVPVAELNTSGRDACPFVLQADDYMIFERDGDIFESTR
jgi:Tol biopolymer transport system component